MNDIPITEIIDRMVSLGVPELEAPLIAAELIQIGSRAAVYRKETIEAMAGVMVERACRCRIVK